MSAAVRRRAVRAASWSLAASAVLVVPVVAGGRTYLALLGAAVCVAAVLAAAQVRHDDVLGWLAASGAAATTGTLAAATRTDVLPGHTAGGWDLAALGSTALSLVVLLAALACAALPLRLHGTRAVGSLVP